MSDPLNPIQRRPTVGVPVDHVTVGGDGWKIAACPVNGPAITAAGRQVTVAWFTMADDRPRVMLARSRDGGATFGEPVVVAEGESVRGRVDLIATAGGESVVFWLEDGALWLARFDAVLGEIRRRSVAEVDGGRISGFPRLAALSADTLLLAWTSSSGGTPAIRVGRVHLGAD